MSLVSLTLDQIAALRQGNSGVPLFPKKKSQIKPRFNERNWNHGLNYGRSKTVPEGKWDHSGFEELCRTEAYAPQPVVPHTNGGIILTKKVVLHITNLAPSVVSEDLKELFEEYSLLSVTVNYDETGKSVGTADIVSDRGTAKKIMANFEGATLDGRAMRFHLIDEEPKPDVRKFRATKNHVTFAPHPYLTSTITYRHPQQKFVGGKVGKSGRKRHSMTTEDLDRELEEYMRKAE